MGAPNHNPLGRLDVLAMRLLETYCQRQPDQQLVQWFDAARPVLDEFIADVLGPIDLMPVVERLRAIQAVAPVRRVPRAPLPGRTP